MSERSIKCIRPLVLVSALAVAAGLLPGPACADPDLILFNARVFTAEAEHPYAEAVAIRGERILGAGSLPAVTALASPDAKRVDLRGKFLMPGMVDAHAHPIEGGLTLVQTRYQASDGSVPKLVQFVESKLADGASHRADALIIWDLDIAIWSQAAAIDAALSSGKFAKQRIVLYGSDGHTAWGNRAALQKAGITQAFIRKLPEGKRLYYGFDAKLQPNGFVVDDGKAQLTHSLPPVAPDTWLAAGRAAVEYMHSNGITGWLDAAPAGVVGGGVPLSPKDPGMLPVYKALGDKGELTVHVRAYPVVQPDLGFSQIDVVQQFQAQYNGTPNFKIPGLKVFADGVVETPSQTAALTRPYVNTGRDVKPLFTPEKMNALVVEAYRRGLAVHIHAIGDLAVRDSLDAFEAARRANPATTLPFAMTHAQFVAPQDIPRFAQLKVSAALQLLWALADPSTNELVKPFIDPAIYQTMYPARALLDTGASVAGASDWPVSSANPFAAMYQAETRIGAQGVLDERQRMPREAMLFAYTREAAAVLDLSAEIGSIRAGKLADLALVDRDLLTVTADDLKDAKVVWTMFGGKIVYGSSPL